MVSTLLSTPWAIFPWVPGSYLGRCVLGFGAISILRRLWGPSQARTVRIPATSVQMPSLNQPRQRLLRRLFLAVIPRVPILPRFRPTGGRRPRQEVRSRARSEFISEGDGVLRLFDLAPRAILFGSN